MPVCSSVLFAFENHLVLVDVRRYQTKLAPIGALLNSLHASASGPEKEALGECIQDLASNILPVLKPDRLPLPAAEIRSLVVPFERKAKAAQKAALKAAEGRSKLMSFEDAVVRGAAKEEEEGAAGTGAASAGAGAGATDVDATIAGDATGADEQTGSCFICCEEAILLLCGATGCTFAGCCGACYGTWLQRQQEEDRSVACCMGTRADGAPCRTPFTVAALEAARLPKAKARRLVDAARRGAVLRADSEWKQATLIHCLPLVRSAFSSSISMGVGLPRAASL